MFKFTRVRSGAAIALVALLALVGGYGTASAQVATNMYGQAQLLPPGYTGPGVDIPGPHGTAIFEQSASGGSTITVELVGMEPGTTHAVTIEDNGCDGPVHYTLNDVKIGADGSATSTTEIPDMVHTESSYISIRTAAVDTANMLCGNVHVIMTAGGGVAGGAGGGTNVPGMPTTGQGDNGTTALLLMGAVLMTFAGLFIGGLGRRAPKAGR
jgi:hypothetical protein